MNIVMRGAFALALLLGAFGAVMAGQQVDVTRLGPQVGETAPEFSLTDQHGQRQDLASASGPKGLMLVFFRSANW